MSDRLDVTFAAVNADPEATCVVLAADGLELGSRAREIDAKSAGAIAKAAAAADYKGKYKSFLEVLAPPKTGIDRVIIAGLGKPSSLSEQQVIDLGGAILANVQSRKGATASVIVDIAQIEDMTPERIAALIGFGAQLRHYNFRKYLTRKHSEDGDKDGLKKLIIQVAHPDKAKAAYGPMKAVGNGVNFARDLVNEPANILGPVELAEKTRALEKLDSASSWGTYDTWFGGDIISSSIKHSRIDDARATMNAVQTQLAAARRELADVGMDISAPDLARVSEGRTLDIWFDNFFSDLSSQSRIGDGRAKVQQLVRELSAAAGRLQRFVGRSASGHARNGCWSRPPTQPRP